MLGGIGPPVLALFLGQKTVELCFGFVVLWKPEEGYNCKQAIRYKRALPNPI